MNDKELRLRLDNIERLIREMHAEKTVGGDQPLMPGDPAFRIVARELLRGNNAPQKALGGRKMVAQ